MEKVELLTGLRAENAQWEAVLAEIGPARLEEPGVAGDWSIKDIVAHLTGWRRRTVGRLQAAGHGAPEPPPPWPAHLHTDEEINAWIYAANHGRPAGDVLTDARQVFEQTLAAIDGLPDKVLQDPARHLAWMNGEPFTASGFFEHWHAEHEPDVRAWLARRRQVGA